MPETTPDILVELQRLLPLANGWDGPLFQRAIDKIERQRAMLEKIHAALCEGSIDGSTDIHDELCEVLGHE